MYNLGQFDWGYMFVGEIRKKIKGLLCFSPSCAKMYSCDREIAENQN